MFRKITLVGIILFLSGCATLYNPATGRSEFIFVNSATEVAIGQEVIPKIIKDHPVLDDVYLQQRVQAVGSRIARISDRQDIEYKFFVLDDKELNAITLPGGFIYANKGLMEAMDDEELAYVLAHEVGHVAARHIAKKIQVNMAYQLLLNVAFASAGESAADQAQNIAKGIDEVYNLIGLSYSRKDEFEADRLAVKYAFKAGFNPYASLSALEKLKQGEGPNWKALLYFRTHPYADDRMQALKVIIPALTGENDWEGRRTGQGYSNPALPLEVNPGKEFVITLESNRTTGFLWQLAKALDKNILKLVSSKYIIDSPELIGSGGREIWTFKAVGLGKTTISFKYVRPWEKGVPAVREVTFLVIVR